MVIFYNIEKVNGTHPDFFKLSKKLEDFQFNLMPVLKEKGYNLTENLDEITGLILYVENDPVASIGLKKIDEETCEIVRVYVSDDYRGNGYAGMLFERVENFVRELGFKNAELVAWCDAKSALRLYEKMGFMKSEEKISEWYGGFKYVELFKKL